MKDRRRKEHDAADHKEIHHWRSLVGGHLRARK